MKERKEAQHPLARIHRLEAIRLMVALIWLAMYGNGATIGLMIQNTKSE
jgi:hypothetical protein